MTAPTTDLVERFVSGFIDAILEFVPPTRGVPPEPLVGLPLPADADEGLSSSGAGFTAGSASLPLPAHSSIHRSELTKEALS